MTGLGDMGHPLATQGQRGLSAGRSQLGPDQVPVVGPQILARDDAPRGALDGGAVLDGDGTKSLYPVINRRSRHTKPLG